MRDLFEARLVNDAFGDPGLYVDFFDERRALLFDIGDISRLPPKKLMRISHVFVSHAHMDHFSGLDHLLRVVLGRKDCIVLYGGPGMVDRVEHKLRAYVWNVVQHYAVELVLDVRERAADGAIRRALFSSRGGFERQPAPMPAQTRGDVLHEEHSFRVRARSLDHGTDCLAFALEERARVRIAKERIAQLGLGTGAWLTQLKHAVLRGAPGTTPITVAWRDRAGQHAQTRSLHELRDVVLDLAPGRRIGYVTDIRYTEPNLRHLEQLLAGVDRLYIECVFLEVDAAHAARKHHLTAHQAGSIAARLGAGTVVPFHYSPRYGERAAELQAELLAAWRAL
ncbi:MAG: ribonuclease Z [Rhodocyclaceae bacterium]|nr:ribonuclease Z [Rhodocyclaceae bacterium]MBX3667452.1 ribonuclease Z [Rhodocyclaceae bacterium]